LNEEIKLDPNEAYTKYNGSIRNDLCKVAVNLDKILYFTNMINIFGRKGGFKKIN